MTPADERILQLLAKWQKSLELHTRYTRLSDDQYWLVQPWPQHQRPSPWIVDLASQRLADLLRIVQSRIAAGDPSLSEALELMSFLANLVGSQHVQRYIPMAEPAQQRPIESLVVQDEPPAAPPPRIAAPPAETPAPAAAAPAHETEPASGPALDEDEDIVRDAIRLLGWGREWHELPTAISRMAGRPKAARVKQVLKARRTEIEQRASAGPARH
jgi:hypothetical protein